MITYLTCVKITTKKKMPKYLAFKIIEQDPITVFSLSKNVPKYFAHVYDMFENKFRTKLIWLNNGKKPEKPGFLDLYYAARFGHEDYFINNYFATQVSNRKKSLLLKAIFRSGSVKMFDVVYMPRIRITKNAILRCCMNTKLFEKLFNYREQVRHLFTSYDKVSAFIYTGYILNGSYDLADNIILKRGEDNGTFTAMLLKCITAQGLPAIKFLKEKGHITRAFMKKACVKGYLDIVIYLRKNCETAIKFIKYCEHYFYAACRSHNLDLVKYFVEKEYLFIDFHCLRQSAKGRNLYILKYLLEKADSVEFVNDLIKKTNGLAKKIAQDYLSSKNCLAAL